MPDPLQSDFNKFNQLEESTKYRSVQFAGLYCIGSPESWHYRVVFGNHKPAVKVGKSVDILKRFNEYRLYYPFSPIEMKVHLMLMMPHAVTKEQKSNLDRAETFVLSELKARYPKTENWPGIDNAFRLHFSRSEWVEGVRIEVIAGLFRKVRDSGEYGPCLFVYNDGRVNVPSVWYEFRKKVIGEAAETRAEKKADQEKDTALKERVARKKSMWDSVYASHQYTKRVRHNPDD